MHLGGLPPFNIYTVNIPPHSQAGLKQCQRHHLEAFDLFQFAAFLQCR